MSEYIKIPAASMYADFYKILINQGFSKKKAEQCAQIFTENSIDGIYTHGVNRFPRFIQYIKNGVVKPDADAKCIHEAGCIEQWDGHSGAGILNALACTDRAIKIASETGMGCVALANTNHWMRGGTYGWRAAKQGFIFIGWTNTTANMPPWGAIDHKLGNNPLVLAVPYQNEALVLDMAMSQFSYGALELYDLKGEKLPVPGGYDAQGKLTTDARQITQSRRVLPIGYWKGAGLSLLLDVLATVLSGGLSTSEISKNQFEHSLSQVFIAIDMHRLSNANRMGLMVQQILNDYHHATPANEKNRILYPGEKVLMTRNTNQKEGIPVLKKVWDEISLLR
jgi:3-dehydro-L-gulonate 2-dehydrogenase